ncbi:TOMM precursor leader peptide-binding protein [Ornithinimicrobium ciconiae]|uniref:TOMM leader peptide-binding protein n=1 Tax=Ornithinimicrobium ciconiae TaxID=2594265 RepID=A0A516G8Q6_9MICO|nr:TOMM precursor leader peptide-binding protein [Ornithinimicrobium ciconiae]QDO87913.1 TOMM precursor leader peptide-binding protein [Ornithinimicrobium ciconiae]
MCPMVRLRPTARPVRRGPGEVQFGLAPGHGIVLAGLSEAESDLLLSLAGDAGTSRDAALARRFGVPQSRVDQFVNTLRAHHLLMDAGDAARLAPVQEPPLLAVPGAGPIVERIRQEFVDAGCRVTAHGDPGVERTELVVLCALDALTPDAGRAWQAAGTAQVPVVLRADAVVIGPLIHPGKSPCLRCLDLHRRDRDGAWPRILSQLACDTDDLTSLVAAPETQAAAVAALVVMVALESLISPQPAVGISWQISLPWPDVRTRRWERHPHCPCLSEPSRR